MGGGGGQGPCKPCFVVWRKEGGQNIITPDAWGGDENAGVHRPIPMYVLVCTWVLAVEEKRRKDGVSIGMY